MLLSAIPVKIYPPKLSEKPLFTMSKSKKELRTNVKRKGGMSRASLSRIFLESLMSAFGGKADIIHPSAKSPLLAKSGHWDAGFSLSFSPALNVIVLSRGFLKT